MNQKKAKKLRRLCKSIEPMIHTKETSVGKIVFQMVKKIRIPYVGFGKTKLQVNHYRNAKKAYKGNVSEAVKAAIRKAQTMQHLGAYSF